MGIAAARKSAAPRDDLCAPVLFLAWSGPEDRRARASEETLLESYLQPRCARLAEERGLTPREAEVLGMLARGHGYPYVAEALYVSEATVRTHARNLYRKLGVSSQEGLLGLIDQL